MLEVRDLSVDYTLGRRSVRAVDHVDLDVQPRRVRRHRRRVGLREVHPAVRHRPAAQPAGGDHQRQRASSTGSDLVAMTDERAAQRALARLLGRHAERDERAQPGAAGRRPVQGRAARRTATIGRDEIRSRSEHVMALVGIDAAHLRSYPHQLSGGMRQRVDDRDGAAVLTRIW